MRRLAIIGAVFVGVGLVAWPLRHDLRTRVSESTWSSRAQYKGTGTATSKNGMQVEWYEVDSKLLDRKLEQVAFVPSGDSHGRSLLVFLHGRGGHPGSFKSQIATAFKGLGDDAPVVVQVAGGDHSYYHDRDDGKWGTYVIDEAIPAALKRFDLDESRIAIGGYSMGGFGAFDIARLHPGTFCAVGGHSAAMWVNAGETPPGAFDDADDFEAHDVIEEARDHPDAYEGVQLWLDGGSDDPFRAANAELVDALHDGGLQVTAHTWSGGHTRSYWNEHFDDYLGFYVAALASCRGAR